MDAKLNKTEQDKLDALLFGIADEADADVDYDAMLGAIYKKAAARKKRTAFVKYGSMAAAAAIVLAVGGLWIGMNGCKSNENAAAPQEPALMLSQGASDSGFDCCDVAETELSTEAASEASEEPAMAAVPNACNSNGYVTGGGEDQQKSTTAAGSIAENAELSWTAGNIALPEISFGTHYEILKNDTDGFECAVYGCTEADAESYMADIAAMYGAKAENGGMTITIDGGMTVALALEGDVLTILMRG